MATSLWFGNGGLGMISTTAARRFDWAGDTVKLALTTVTYTPSQDNDDFFNDVTNELATANGYTAGGLTLTTKATAYDGASNTVRMTADNPSWTFTGAGVTFRWGVIYKDTGVTSTSPLIGYIDMGTSLTITGVWTITLPTDGILRMVAS